VATIVALQQEYRAWFENLPANLEGSRLADKLEAIAELDLEELQAIDPPRVYGRDRSRKTRAQPHLDLARTCTARWQSVDPRIRTTRGAHWCLDITAMFGTRSAYPIWASGHPTALQ
jgi:hypothetical protein